MNDETQTDKTEVEATPILDAFTEAHEADGNEDEIKMAMIGAGATFKNVTRLYNTYMVDAGFAVSKEEKAEIVGKAVDGKDVSTEEGLGKVVAAICKKASGVTEKSAAALVRSWAKTQDPAVEVFAKPKGTGEARVGFKSRFYDALVANPAMSKDECSTYLKEAEGSSANILKHESNYQGIRKLANRLAGVDDGSAVEEAEAA